MARTSLLLALCVLLSSVPAGADAPTLAFARSLSGVRGAEGRAVAVGPDGSIYVAGETASADFPTTPGAFQRVAGGAASAAFVARLAPDGAVLWSTLLSGTSGRQGAEAIDVDSEGFVYVAGFTEAGDFPTTPGAYDTSGPGAFVAKLAPDGSALVYSTITASVVSTVDIDVDSAGRAYLLYDSNHVTVPLVTPGAFDTRFNESELVLVKLDATGSTVLFGTFLGGVLSEFGAGLVVDASGVAHVAGYTSSGPSFPTTPGVILASAPQNQIQGFLSAIAPDGASLVYSTFLGADVFPRALDLAPDGGVVVAGTAVSGMLVTPGVYDESPNGRIDTIVMRVTAGARGRVYTTLLGGRGDDVPVAVRVGAGGTATIAGRTASSDFPAIAPDASYGGGTDGYVAALGAAGDALLLASYAGGDEEDTIAGMAVDGLGGVALAGTTASSDFATEGAAGPRRAFAARLDTAGPYVDAAVTASAPSLYVGGRGTLVFSVTNAGTAPATGPVALTARLPEGLSPVSATGTGWTATIAGRTVEARRDGALAPGARAELVVTVDVAPSAVPEVEIVVEVSTPDDARPGNDTATLRARVAVGPPPEIATVSAVERAGKPFKVKIVGRNFDDGIEVFIGADTTAWQPSKRKGETQLLLKGGSALAARFPVGVDVPVRLRNPDGGEAMATVRR